MAEEAARRAGAILLKFSQDGVRYGFKDNPERGRELVSEADLEADRAIHETIRAAFPNDGYLSEEQEDTGERLQHTRVWIVDPLDGTKAGTSFPTSPSGLPWCRRSTRWPSVRWTCTS